MLRFRIAAPPILGLVLFASLSGMVATVDAAPIFYGDFGPDFPPGAVIYHDVTESSGTDPTPLYGPPTITGDVLDFDPMGFVASATDGVSDITDGQLNFGMSMLPGAGITSLLLTESGDYTLFGGGTAATTVAMGLSIGIDILAVDHMALTTPISVSANMAVVRDLLNNGPVVLAPWSNGLLVDFGAVLTNNNIDFDLGVTAAKVVINDQLLAISEDLSLAFVAKKEFRIEPWIEGRPIPEPATLALFALGGLALLRRR
ncbi:MAG: PEP-CTERM sorting domain-containing protein [Phycisphaerae bacterium]|nr:PEP-CTERM sorting domain-containing protein [Phycisphaerae bacterium]